MSTHARLPVPALLANRLYKSVRIARNIRYVQLKTGAVFLYTFHMMPGDDPRVSAAVEIEHWATSPGAVLGAFLVFARGIFPLAAYLVTGNFIPLVACYSGGFFQGV